MPMHDTSPADDFFAITPNDGVNLPKPVRALLIAAGGSLQVTKLDGTVANIVVPAGQFNARVSRVWATGTAATGITGLV